MPPYEWARDAVRRMVLMVRALETLIERLRAAATTV